MPKAGTTPSYGSHEQQPTTPPQIWVPLDDVHDLFHVKHRNQSVPRLGWSPPGAFRRRQIARPRRPVEPPRGRRPLLQVAGRPSPVDDSRCCSRTPPAASKETCAAPSPVHPRARPASLPAHAICSSAPAPATGVVRGVTGDGIPFFSRNVVGVGTPTRTRSTHRLPGGHLRRSRCRTPSRLIGRDPSPRAWSVTTSARRLAMSTARNRSE